MHRLASTSTASPPRSRCRSRDVPAAYLGLGSNVGDRLATLRRAVDLLERAGVHVLTSSRVWETEPVGGPPGQPAFLNAVLHVQADLDPHALLRAAHDVEDRLGRVRVERW